MKNTKYVEVKHDGDFKQFLIGSYLGDGSFTKTGNGAKNSRLSMAHGLNQKEYAIRKWGLLNSIGIAGKLSINKIYGERYKLGYFEEIRFKSLSHPIFTYYRDKGYDDTKKLLHMDLVTDINPLGLAIWFMDDGNRTNDSCEIGCQKFSTNEKEMLSQLILDRFQIWTTCTANTIYVLKGELSKFREIVNPFMLDSLKYKLEPYRGSV